jgi:hypothetical protein
MTRMTEVNPRTAPSLTMGASHFRPRHSSATRLCPATAVKTTYRQLSKTDSSTLGPRLEIPRMFSVKQMVTHNARKLTCHLATERRVQIAANHSTHSPTSCLHPCRTAAGRITEAKAEAEGVGDDMMTDEERETGSRSARTLVLRSSAEVDWSCAQTLDPYGVGPKLPEEFQQVGREHFARSPGSNVWSFLTICQKRFLIACGKG